MVRNPKPRAPRGKSKAEAKRVAAPPRVREPLTQAEAGIRVVERMLKAKEAQNSLIAFTEMTMPDIADPDDATKTRYDAQYFHRALAKALEEVEAGNILRLIITFPPRHGKSELTSRRFPAWVWGRDPYRSIIFGTYNQPIAEDFGKDVRDILQSPAYSTIFPECKLAKGSAASDRLKTVQGGMAVFVGRGGSATGRGGDILILDDPIKDRQEASSDAVRKEVWEWFNDTISTRLMSDTGAIIIIQTRWHEDDLVGRLIDPSNPHYNKEEAAAWKVINIPALAGENDILDRKPGEALWPSRFGKEWLEAFRRRNPVGFSALYQQEPNPVDGEFFKAEDISEYKAGEAPANLRIYAASDHAVGEKQQHDLTCLLIIGVDQHDNIWLLDCWWKRARTDVVVEAMIKLMKRWKPLCWWAESGHISKSIGPFLTKRMREEKVYIKIREQTPAADKSTRAQSIQGRCSMGMVRFPKGASWYSGARSELLKFPSARHDDFVDALAHVGLGLDTILKAPVPQAKRRDAPRVGTMGWVKEQHNLEKKQARRLISLGGL